MMHALASSVGIERLHFLKKMDFTWQDLVNIEACIASLKKV